MVSIKRGNTGEGWGSEVPAICRVERGRSCTKKEAKKSAHHKLYVCKVGLYKTWQRNTKGCELTGASGVDTVVGDTVPSKQLEQRDPTEHPRTQEVDYFSPGARIA